MEKEYEIARETAAKEINERAKNLVQTFLGSEEFAHRCEAFIETFNKEISTDEDPFDNKGFHALKAVAENNVNDFLIAVCGWSFESLLKKAFLLRDEKGEFYPTPLDAEFVSVWDGGTECRTACKVNLRTFEVYDIEHDTSSLVETLDELDEEFVEIDGTRCPVYPHDQLKKDNVTDFWYGEEE